ncbi:hypothetical protein Q2328_25235, partial [Escherichia coli]|nr:hypothetical protein [Escherichia coli]
RLKYDALHIHNRISLRCKPGNKKANQLLKHLLDLLDPSKLDTEQSNAYSRWRELSDKAVQEARFLLKEEWEYTKN